MNEARSDDLEQRLATLVMSLREAEDLVDMLDEVCCRMRHVGRGDQARVEVTMAIPTRRRRGRKTESPPGASEP